MEETILEIVEKSCRIYRDVIAVKYLSHREIVEKSYGDMWDDIRKTAVILRNNGLCGTHIALVGSSSYEWICAYMAILFTGNTAVPLDANLSAPELHELLNRSESTALFCGASRKDVITELKADCPRMNVVFTMEKKVDIERPEGADSNPQLAILSFEQLRSEITIPDDFAFADQDKDKMCTLMYTSGTTGKSKGVMLSQFNLAQNVENVYVNLEPGVTILSVLPIHHAFCLTMEWMKGISLGATICINDSLLHMLKNMKRFQPVGMLMVPLMVETIYKKLKDVNPLLPKKLVAKEAFGGKLEYRPPGCSPPLPPPRSQRSPHCSHRSVVLAPHGHARQPCRTFQAPHRPVSLPGVIQAAYRTVAERRFCAASEAPFSMWPSSRPASVRPTAAAPEAY